MKKRQETLGDAITFIANIIVLGIFWVKVEDGDSLMILNILMDIADLISTTEYRSVDEKYKERTKYIVHTLVVYISTSLQFSSKLQRA